MRGAEFLRKHITRKRIIALYAVILFFVASIFTYFHPLQFISYQLAFLNPAPQVIPALQEWHGSSGSFALSNSARIVVDLSYSRLFKDTAHMFHRDQSN